MRVDARLERAARITAALFGSLPVALGLSLCVSLYAPLSPNARFALGFFLAPIFWVAGMCAGFLARSGLRAWAGFAALSGLLALLVAIH
jgi:hypothetical protein